MSMTLLAWPVTLCKQTSTCTVDWPEIPFIQPSLSLTQRVCYKSLCKLITRPHFLQWCTRGSWQCFTYINIRNSLFPPHHTWGIYIYIYIQVACVLSVTMWVNYSIINNTRLSQAFTAFLYHMEQSLEWFFSVSVRCKVTSPPVKSEGLATPSVRE